MNAIAPAKVPDGYMEDGRGALVRTEMVKPIDKLRTDLVRELVDKARRLNRQLSECKSWAFGEIDAFLDMSAEVYEVTLRSKKGNFTLYTFDKSIKVVVQVADNLIFDERLQIAKALIDECIHDWGADARPELMALLNDAFQVDKEGKIATGRVLGLRRLDIQDEKWQSAMRAISDSVQTSFSKRYVRFYERVGDSDEYRAIPLDISKV